MGQDAHLRIKFQSIGTSSQTDMITVIYGLKDDILYIFLNRWPRPIIRIDVFMGVFSIGGGWVGGWVMQIFYSFIEFKHLCD